MLKSGEDNDRSLSAFRAPPAWTKRLRRLCALGARFPPAHAGVLEAKPLKLQVADKVEVQEALPPAGVLGAEPLSLMPQHFPREPAKRCVRAMAANQSFFDSLEF